MKTDKNEKYVFFDLNDGTLNLAQSVANENPMASILFAVDTVAGVSPSLESSAMQIASGFFKAERYRFSDAEFKRIFEAQSLRMFFLSGNSERNLNTALFAVEKVAEALQTKPEDISLYVETYAADAEKIFSEKRDSLGMGFSLKVLQPASLAALSLIHSLQPADLLDIDTSSGLAMEDFSLAVIGFGRLGKAALLDLYRVGCFEGSAFKARIFDANANYLSGKFASDFPGMAKDSSFEFEEVNACRYAFVERMRSEAARTKMFVVALGDDALNVKTANLISELVREAGAEGVKIACSLWDGKLATEIADREMVKVFGSFEDICTADIMLGDRLELCGRLVNDFYNSTKSDASKMKNWNFMSRFDKDSNIFVAIFNGAYKRLLGFNPFVRFSSAEEFRGYLAENPDLAENLARTEHRRWMAFMYAAGWDAMPSDGILAANKDEKAKLHTCLVPYDCLGKISELFNEDYKQYDRDNVGMIYDIAARLDF